MYRNGDSSFLAMQQEEVILTVSFPSMLPPLEESELFPFFFSQSVFSFRLSPFTGSLQSGQQQVKVTDCFFC
jgi:hypothetical protein